MTDDLELLHQCKLQLRHSGATVTLDTRVFEELLGLAHKGLNTADKIGWCYKGNNITASTDLRISPGLLVDSPAELD